MQLLKKLALSLALLACSLPLYAADSASNRSSQFIRFGTKAIAIHTLYLRSSPMEVEFPGKNITIGVAGGTGSTEELVTSSSGIPSFKTVVGSTSEVNIRYYPGNSFNWLLGYGKYKLELKDWPSEDSTTYDVAYETTQVNFGIGNEWTFDFGMYIGADWLMLGSKLSDSYTATLVSGTETTASKAYVETDTSSLGAAGGAAIFRIGFGF